MNTNKEKSNNIDRAWYLLDADDKVLGRLATQVATLLRGKNRVEFEKSIDIGNYVVVINADKIRLTGKKEEQKLYRYHTNYIGSLKEIPYKDLRSKKPDFIIKKAVKGMLPDNKLSRRFMKRLKVYCGNEHPHASQEIELLG